MRELCWGPDGMMDQLKPKHQGLHDIFDMHRRSHWDINDPHKMFERFNESEEAIEEEITRGVKFLEFVNRPDCKTFVINSNHDRALERWLKVADYRRDPVNALFFLEAQLAWYQAIKAGEQKLFHLLAWTMKTRGAPKDVVFLRQDESYEICAGSGQTRSGIDCGYHGDMGPGGSRGSPALLAKMGQKMVVGHTHSAGIFDGTYSVGILSNLDQEYNHDPSSWSHTSCVVYPNGKRCLVTVRGNRWRA